MTVFGLDFGALGDLWSLAGAAGGGLLGLAAKALKGPWSCIAVFLAGMFAMHWLDGLLVDRDALARERAYNVGLQVTLAANEAQRRVELADRDRALAAAEAAADAERTRRDDLEATLEELRHAPAEDDRPLSPTAQRFFDGLRGD